MQKFVDQRIDQVARLAVVQHTQVARVELQRVGEAVVSTKHPTAHPKPGGLEPIWKVFEVGLRALQQLQRTVDVGPHGRG